MYWTLDLASKLEDAPWPATKEELIDYAIRSGAPHETFGQIILLRRIFCGMKMNIDVKSLISSRSY